MTAGATKGVWENSRASNGSLIVLLAIADEIDKGRDCVMSVSEMARKTRLSERAVQNAVRECERLGELKVWAKAGGHGRNGYVLPVRMGAESAPLPASKGADTAPAQNLHPAESAPLRATKQQVKARGAESAPLEKPDILLTVTGSSLVEVKETPAEPPSLPDRPDVERLCARLADRIEANGSKRPVISRKWRDAARLLIDKDGRTEEQIGACVDWCQHDEFWRGNVMSMPTLRDKYDRLRLDAIRKMNAQKRNTRQPDEADQQEALEIARQLDAMEAM